MMCDLLLNVVFVTLTFFCGPVILDSAMNADVSGVSTKLNQEVSFASGPDIGKIRVGVYDSRAFAIAYISTPAYAQAEAEFWKVYEKARDAGDAKRVAELNAAATEKQKRRYNQGFSTAPVEDCLAFLQNKMEIIVQDTGVKAIISKWDEAALSRYPGAERVDVTMQLVDALQPDAYLREWSIVIQTLPPFSKLPVSETEQSLLANAVGW